MASAQNRRNSAADGSNGFHKRTQHNQRILKIGEDVKDINQNGWKNYGIIKTSYILLKGSVQGTEKRMIRLRSAIRQKKNRRYRTADNQNNMK